MIEFDDILFHESTILDLSKKEGTISIKVTDAEVGHNGKRISVLVVFYGVCELKIDNVISKNLGMECEDGEIVTLRRDGDGVFLLVTWHDFKTKSIITKSYRFSCSNIRCRED